MAPVKKLSSLALLVIGLSACQPAGTSTFTVPVGVSREVGFHYSLNQDCSSLGDIDVRVVEPPQHGTLEIRTGPVHPNFPETNPRFVCNTRTVPGKQDWYTPAAGYTVLLPLKNRTRLPCLIAQR
jgi:hypothetical protein